jgi:hypothetical protein
MSDLNCTEYSEKAIVVRGEATKTYKEDLKTLGGKYNANLKGGAGWIFSKTSQGKVNKFITSVKNGEVTPSSPSEVRTSPRAVRASQPPRTSQPPRASSPDYTSILQDISSLMDGKDPEYKLSFLSSVTLLLSRPRESVPQKPAAPAAPQRLLSKKTVESLVIASSDEEEDAPPRMRLLM